MMSSWTLKADARFGVPGVALAPWPWYVAAASSPTHIRIHTEAGETAVLKVQPSGNQTGEVLIVAPGTFGLVDREEATAETQPLSLGEYYRHWLGHTQPGQLTVLGLLMAVMGQALKVSLDLGEAWPVLDIGDGGVAIVKTLTSVLTVGGLTLSAWQAVLKS